jgi:DNA (cytosine-5)-methyltransferase 1
MRAVSLFSGAGGLDVGFVRAGFDIVWANDFNKDACETYKLNIGNHIEHGDINELLPTALSTLTDISVVFGGPPCQGFSVAGKMNPQDPRSWLVYTFAEAVRAIQPRAFVMENVKALGCLKKWQSVRDGLLSSFRSAGYSTSFAVLNSCDYNVPQARERVFFVGFRDCPSASPDLQLMMSKFRTKSPSVRKALNILGPAGTGNNKLLTKAKITIAPKPVMRKSPYAGMLFNGSGRPVKIDGYSATLPATMGGNKTPIIDEDALYNGKVNWVENYHRLLVSNPEAPRPAAPPSSLRRLTLAEASVIQTFPLSYKFHGPSSSVFRQIGNAVPCNLAFAIASMIKENLGSGSFQVSSKGSKDE